MKKILLLTFAFTSFLLEDVSSVKAQCYGTVAYDASANGNGNNTFTITTSHCNELIMITYDGWPGPGNGPVTVNGNPATHINTAFVYYYAVAETYAYNAGPAGTYSIACTEYPYGGGPPSCYLNSAASFYVLGSSSPISIGSLTNQQNTISCNTGGPISASISTSIPGSMIYDNFDCNNGQWGPFTDSWVGGTFLNQLHEWDGIDESEAYTIASTPTTYSITANCSAQNNCCGCGGEALLLVAIPPPLCSGGGGHLTAKDSSVNPTCGGNNGKIFVDISGGISPYTYSWSPNVSTTDSATGLSAGVYTITINDDGCPTSDTTIVDTLKALTMNVSATATGTILCNGNCTGSAKSVVTGGSSPYNYLWSPSGGVNATASGLCGGTYTVSVQDKNGCTATATVTITQPPALMPNLAVINVPCFGGTGNAIVAPSGGVPAYTYSWSAPGGTTASLTGLSVGSYTITVTDANGCTATAKATITQPAKLTASISASAPPLCNGGTGTATVAPVGGTPTFTYSWSPAGGSNATGTGLSANTPYTVTVTDANGCTASASVSLTQPTAVTAIISQHTYPLCNGGIGSASVLAGGGTPNYTYSWNPSGQTNANATALASAIYTVTVKDANGCTATASVNITQPALLTIVTSFTHASCNLSNGNATASPQGGTSPYTYSWTPSGQTTATATGLSTGTYTVSVKDINGCSASAIVTVTQPSAVTAVITANTDVSCKGGNNATATVNAVGGNTPYIYSWTPAGGTNAIGTGLSAGTFTVTVKDANGCSSTASVTITQPAQLTATISASSGVSCNGGSNATASVAAAGGTPAYTYAWNPSGQTNANATGLSALTYTVTVTDAHGCTASAKVAITQPTVLAVSCTINNVPCNGGIGNVVAAPSGGTPNYNYAWSPIGGTGATGTGLSAGTYTVNVTDAHGCTVSASVLVTQPATLSVTASFTAAFCNRPDGTASAFPAGGTLPYAYKWNPSGQTSPTASNLTAGSYTVTVTDKNHCTVSAQVTVTQPSVVVPAINATTPVSCNGGSNGTATASASGGDTPYTYLWTPGGNPNAYGTGLTAGTYTMTVTDASGCAATISTTITQPRALIANVTASPQVICLGGTGKLTASVSGGTSPYLYSWGPNIASTADTAFVSPLTPQSYTVTVTDANGCKTIAVTSIQIGPPLSITFSKAASICKGSSATLCVTPNGGLGGNVFTWQPGNLSTPCITVSPASTTVYTVSVSDNCGATATANVPVFVGIPPIVNFSADIYQGCAPLCIQFRNSTTLPQGGIHSCVWQFGNGDTSQASNPVYCYPDSGTFGVTLTVIPDSGCSASLSKINLIRVYQHPIAAFSLSPQPATILAPTIQFADKSYGPADIEYWLWNFGDQSDTISKLQNPEHTYRDTGTYCANLVVMDAHGCTDTATNCLVIQPSYNLYIPSAFSPNGDGINDVFQPKGQYIQSFDMYIFDRWGMQLYHTTDINKGWDGMVGSGSTIAQEDTYIYKITVTDSQGNAHSYVGNVTLIK